MLRHFVVRGIVGALLAAALPPLVTGVTNSSRLAKPTVAIALLGICTGLAWLAVAWLWHRRRGSLTAPMLAVVAVVTVFAGFVARDPERNWDYSNAYELPAQQILAGISPYTVGETTNPPTSAQLTGLVGMTLARTVLVGATGEVLWFWVFYLFQAMQLALVALLFTLSYVVARNAGREPLSASMIAAAGMLLCAPLHEAFLLNQINLLVVVIVVAAVMLIARSPAAAGALAAFGGAIKLYPFALWLYWAWTKHWRAVVASVVTLGVIVGLGWTAWRWYFDYLLAFERPLVVRDASLHGTIASVVRVVGGSIGMEASALQPVSFVLWIVADAVLLFWMWRQHQHRRADDVGQAWPFVAALPLIFPLAWVHHYLFVLPLAVHHVAARAVLSAAGGAGILLALVLPAFDTFPLGVTRPLGTLLLLAAHIGSDE